MIKGPTIAAFAALLILCGCNDEAPAPDNRVFLDGTAFAPYRSRSVSENFRPTAAQS